MACAYVASNVTAASFFATPILLGKNGVEKNLGLGALNKYEADKLAKEVLFINPEIRHLSMREL